MKWKQKATVHQIIDRKCLRPQHPLRSSTGLKTAPYSIKSKGYFFYTMHKGMRMIFLIDPEALNIFRPIDFMVVCIPGSPKTEVCVCASVHVVPMHVIVCESVCVHASK